MVRYLFMFSIYKMNTNASFLCLVLVLIEFGPRARLDTLDKTRGGGTISNRKTCTAARSPVKSSAAEQMAVKNV